jgi:PIN domain nuclease of toxin-antitoxin system
MDRIIAATARAENLPLVTADQRMWDCPLLKTIW